MPEVKAASAASENQKSEPLVTKGGDDAMRQVMIVCSLAGLLLLNCASTTSREIIVRPVTVATIPQNRIDDTLVKSWASMILNIPEESVTVRQCGSEYEIEAKLNQGQMDYAVISSHLLKTSPLKKFTVCREFPCGDQYYSLLYKR